MAYGIPDHSKYALLQEIKNTSDDNLIIPCFRVAHIYSKCAMLNTHIRLCSLCGVPNKNFKFNGNLIKQYISAMRNIQYII